MKALIYQLQEAGIKQWKKIYLEEPQKNLKHNEEENKNVLKDISIQTY